MTSPSHPDSGRLPPPRPPGTTGAPRWTREQIRAARLIPLAPILQKRGLLLVARPEGNFTLPTHPGLILKDAYWRWPERNLSGNAIDLLTGVLGLSFHDAMRVLLGP